MTMHGSSSTILRISEAALSPYASRGMSQTLNMIDATADLRRTVNGELRNFSDTVFQKYAAQITGRDQRPPSIDGVWPGRIVTLESMAELSYVTAEGSATRSVLTGSSRVEGTLTFYRPVLTMMVTAFDQTFDEFNAAWDWNISLEEV
jgi:hypothetical protein